MLIWLETAHIVPAAGVGVREESLIRLRHVVSFLRWYPAETDNISPPVSRYSPAEQKVIWLFTIPSRWRGSRQGMYKLKSCWSVQFGPLSIVNSWGELAGPPKPDSSKQICRIKRGTFVDDFVQVGNSNSSDDYSSEYFLREQRCSTNIPALFIMAYL